MCEIALNAQVRYSIIRDKEGCQEPGGRKVLMRPIEYVQIVFYVVLGLLAVLVAAQAIATLRDISVSLRQTQVRHEQLLQDHQAQMQRLTR